MSRDDLFDAGDPYPAGDSSGTGDESAPEEPPLQQCWRCGKSVDERLAACPYCLARLRPDRWPATYRKAARGAGAVHAGQHIKTVMWFYGIFLLTSIIFAAILFVDAKDNRPQAEQERELLHQTLAVEVIDTILLVVALAVADVQRAPRQSGGVRIMAWAWGAPILGAMFGLNYLYFMALQRFVGEAPLLDPVQINLRTDFWLVVLAICVQPAVVEELFFRYLALGQLRRVMGMHGAVWISAVMFGFAHLYNPLGIPYLIVLGAGLGYVRVASGGLALPMLMHGFHNYLVLLLEA